MQKIKKIYVENKKIYVENKKITNYIYLCVENKTKSQYVLYQKNSCKQYIVQRAANSVAQTALPVHN